MKNILFYAGLICATTTWSQITISENSKVVIEANCQATDLKMTIKLPETAKKYDQIKVTVQTISPVYGEDYEPYGANITVDVKNITNNSIEADLLINGTKSEFLGGSATLPYLVINDCDDAHRYDEKFNARFVVYGGKITKYVMKEDWYGNLVSTPEYAYTELIRDQKSFKMNYGPVDPYIQSIQKSYKITRFPFENGKFMNERNEQLEEMNFMIGKEGSDDLLYTQVQKFDASEVSSSQIKTDVTKYLLKNSNPEQSGFLTTENFSLFSAKGTGYFYIPEIVVPANGNIEGTVAEDDDGGFDMGAQSARDVKVKDRSKEITGIQKKMGWKPGKMGNLTGEILEVNYYSRDQMDINEDRTVSVKSSEKGKTKKLMVFVGEKDGATYYIFSFKEGSSAELTAEQQSFLTDLMKSFTVN